MDVLECVQLRLPQDKPMLERFYNELMIPNFPLKEELEPLDRWIPILESSERNTTEGSGMYLNVMVCFDGRDAERKTLIGGIVFEYYYPSNCALITYLVTNPSVRGSGSGVFLGIHAWGVMKKLAQKHGHPNPHIIFCEVNDPALISDSEDSLSPLQRLRAFQQMGVRHMENFQYVQPALEGQTERARGMMLAVVVGPMTPRDDATGASYVHSEHVRAFLRDFYQDLGVSDLQKDEDYQRMMKCLEGRDKVFLRDFDLSRFKPSKKKPAPSIQATLKTATIPVHICVIGAGVSGMAAARQLREAGFAVTIVEGRSRPGGRLYTSRIHDTRVDLGAAWFHGLEGNPLSELVLEAIPNLPLYKSNEQALVLYDRDGKEIEQTLVFETYMKFLGLLDALKTEYNPEGKDEDDPSENGYEAWKRTQPKVKHTLQEALDALYKKNPQLRLQSLEEKVVLNHLFSNVESLQGAPMRVLNGRDYAHGTEYDGGDFIVTSGFQNVTVLLRQGLDIQTDKKVVKVEWDTSKSKAAGGKLSADSLPQVKVHFEKGDAPLLCNGVIFTGSAGVLQSNLTQFVPPLPNWKQEAISNLGMGLFNKVVMRFPKRFWPASADYLGFNFPAETRPEDLSLDHLHASRENTWFVNYEPVAKEPILIAMLSGSLAERLEKRPDAEVVAEVMRRLRIMYGKDIPNPLDTLVTRWGQDPFSAGSYSYLKAGSSIVDVEKVGEPVEGCIFFAGEHTSTDRFGYVDGAYVSGLREAKRIIEQYKHIAPQIKAKL